MLPASEGYTFPPGARVDIELLGDVLFVVRPGRLGLRRRSATFQLEGLRP